jgi:hypothetical protein
MSATRLSNIHLCTSVHKRLHMSVFGEGEWRRCSETYLDNATFRSRDSHGGSAPLMGKYIWHIIYIPCAQSRAQHNNEKPP